MRSVAREEPFEKMNVSLAVGVNVCGNRSRLPVAHPTLWRTPFDSAAAHTQQFWRGEQEGPGRRAGLPHHGFDIDPVRLDARVSTVIIDGTFLGTPSSRKP